MTIFYAIKRLWQYVKWNKKSTHDIFLFMQSKDYGNMY